MRGFPSPGAWRRWAIGGLLLLAAGLAPPGDGEAELRTWKDVSGRFKIQARFVGVEGENVTLRKPDGKSVQVLLDRLCSADRTYVADIQKRLADEDPFKPKEEDEADPFRPKPAAPRAGAMTRPARTAPGGTPVAPGVGGEPAAIEADWSSAQLAALPPDGAWKVTVEAPAADPAAAPARVRGVPIPPTTEFFEGRKGYALSPAGTYAAVGYALENPKPGTTRVVIADLKSGKSWSTPKAPGVMGPLAVSDSGDRVLMRREEFGFGNSDRLELWAVSPQGVAREWSLVPYGDVQGPARDVKWAAFLGDDRFATIGGQKLVLWDLDPVRPTVTLTVADGCVPALSPDGRLLAFAGDGKVGLLDVRAGEVAALQPLPALHAPWPAFGFSPSGRRFACHTGGKLFVWDVEDGALHREILLHPLGVPPDRSPIWTDDDHVLLADRVLIDVEGQVKAWEFQGPEAAAGDRQGLCWFLIPARPNQPGALVPARLPQPNMQQAVKKALADPEFFIVRPGATVSIDPSGLADASRRAEVVAALTALLARMDVKVAPGATVTLLPTVEAGKEQEISYRTVGAGFRTDTFKVRPQISRLRMTYRGQPAWESAASTLPPFDFAHLGPNESLADHVRKFEQPNYAYFGQVELPRLLARPGPGGSSTLGTSQVSTAGIR